MPHVRIPDELKQHLLPLDELRPNPDNPNNGDVDEVAISIQVNGFLVPIIVDHNTGMITSGHTRYHAMLALGQTHIPGFRVMFDKTQLGAERFMIADNRTGRLARMDEHQESVVLAQLQDTEIGLVGTGWDDNAYHNLLLQLSQEPPPPGGDGWGGPAPSGIYQVILEFDNEEDMEGAATMLADSFPTVRTVRL